MEVVMYTEDKRVQWDDFVRNSKNGTFLFLRDYMEYHSDQFKDYSLMFYNDNGKLTAVLPANIDENIVTSHGGLTYGGVISNRKMNTLIMLEVFVALIEFLSSQGIRKLIYKRVPYFYYNYPSDEDLYALWRNGGKVVRADISTTIELASPIKFSETRRQNIRDAKTENIEVSQSDDFGGYYKVLCHVLEQNHAAKPVHSEAELLYLKDKFPKNIKLFTATKDGEIISGVVIFETKTVAHTQYIANSAVGRGLGALDLLFDHLVHVVYKDKKYFDFGTSNENQGQDVNEGLITQKQMFGGRGTIHEFWEVEING
ncbi:hypothetical protein FACS1894125_1300 [Actinomycetota bacterium]|nr:hypothetical protein FACS1894125_1300 [Actinomycetota bacterium]